jgi:hypothetical protein
MNSPTFPLPIKGINKGNAVCTTPSEYSSDMNNVRPTDVQGGRQRLGKRPGLVKWGEGTQIGSIEEPVVAIAAINRVS